jgi:hypothetical protein
VSIPTEELLKIKSTAADLRLEASWLIKSLKELCHHPEDYCKDDSYYFRGGYMDMAYTESWRECTICGKKGEVTTREHNHYG